MYNTQKKQNYKNITQNACNLEYETKRNITNTKNKKKKTQKQTKQKQNKAKQMNNKQKNWRRSQ